MAQMEQRISFLLNKLYYTYSFEDVQQVESIGIADTFYKTEDKIPDDAYFTQYDNEKGWGGKRDSHYWFVFEIFAPENFEDYVLSVKTGYNTWHASNPQFIVYIDGEIVQGLDENHTEIKLSKAGRQTVWLYAYTGSETDDKLKLCINLIKVRRDIRRLFYQLYVLSDIVSISDENSREYKVNLAHIKNTLSYFDFTSKRLNEETVAKALAYLQENAVGHNNADETVYCVGQTHIDVEWLWTLAQTKEKVQRSFSNVLTLMDEYKDCTFFASTPLLYEYIKETQPKLYEKIKKLIKKGRWDADGAMWVEADNILSSGESLIRQLMLGKKYFKDNFGIDSKILWLPDCFGFSASFPQIAKSCGIDWLVTSKISWSQTNQFPHDIFEWQGIDGSKLKTYFLTATSKGKHGYDKCTIYNGSTTARQVLGTCERLTEKELSDIVLLSYGFGDGGGGPTIGGHEQRQFIKKGVVGLPKIKDATVGEFFNDLDKRLESKTLPKWKGELYLEYHRGTYTSIAKAKRGNRKIEFLLSNAEFLCAVNADYQTKEEVDKIWKTVLTHQFHDALPGSSVEGVYKDIEKDYAGIAERLSEIIQEQAQKIVKSSKLSGDAVVFNFNSHTASGEVSINGKNYYVTDIPSKGYKVVKLTQEKPEKLLVSANKTLENEQLKVVFDDNFQMVSVFCKKAQRELVRRGGTFNALSAYMDVNHIYDAWELHEDYATVRESVVQVEKVEYFNNGLRAGVIVVRKFRNSTITEKISIGAYSDTVDVETQVDWQEKNTLLKTEFDVDIMADKATYNIQFGNIERSTLNNTTYEQAQFEVPFHKFFDLSEGDYGVAILNDCKYGGFVKENKMSLTLIKSASYPWKDADVGHHEFKYSIMPHTSNHAQGRVTEKAYALNNPLFALRLNGDMQGKVHSFIQTDCDNVIIETVKLSEDGKGYVVRIYESSNGKANAKIKLNAPALKIVECDALENELQTVAENSGEFECYLSNYQIKTFKVII